MTTLSHSRQPAKALPGFSLVEVMISVVLIGIVAAVAVMAMSNSKSSVMATKLQSDVQKLNEIVAVYLANGGSLSGLSTPQQVIDQLKTTRPTTDDQRNVGVMTGRGVDVRLTAQMQTTTEANASNPYVTWDAAHLKFVYNKGVAGVTAAVSNFVLNDALLGQTIANDTRSQSNELYNGSNGWVWAPGNNTTTPPPGPTALALQDTSNVFSPVTYTGSTSSGFTTSGSTTSGSTTSGSTTSGSTTSGSTTSGSTTSGSTTSGSTTSGSTTSGSTTSGSTTSGSTTSGSTTSGGTPSGGGLPSGGSTTPVKLPTPIISPGGGIYAMTLYPTQIYINPNGAPDGSSILKYSLNNGPWMVYTGPFSVPSGTIVKAYNYSTNPLYTDSDPTTQSYYYIVPNFTGTVTAQWNASSGPTGFTSTINNSNANNVVENDGLAVLGFLSNQFNFVRTATFTAVPPNTQFTIGTLSYRNGTVGAIGNSNFASGASAVHLHLNIAMTSPSVASTGADINIALTNTPNNNCAAASADIATLSNPQTNYSIVIGGVTYTLQVQYGTIDVSQGFVDTNNTALHVYEGATGTVPIVANFVSSTP